MDFIINGIKTCLHKIIDVLGTGVGFGLDQLHDVFVLVAMVRIFFMMAGLKNLGTKFTSISILSYIILKVVFKC
jgi:hypothetical protein